MHFIHGLTRILAALILCAAGVEPVLAQPPDSLSLPQILTRVLDNHPAIQRAQEDVHAAQARVEQARSAYYPTVDGTGNYLRLDPVSEFNIGGNPVKVMPNDNWDVHLGARQNVYDFGRRSAQTELSRRRVTSARDQVDGVRSNLAFSAARAFYKILYLEHSRAVVQQQLSALNEHLDIARRKLETGTALRYDVLSTQVRVAAVENQRTDIENSIARQYTILRELMGLPDSAALHVSGDAGAATPALNADTLAALAFRQRVELQLARDAEAAARAQQEIARLSDRPNLNAGVQYGFKNGYEPDIYDIRSNWAATAQVQVPIFNGSRRRYLQQEADATLRAEEDRRKTLERQVRSEVSNAVADLQAAQNKLQTSDVRIQQAEEAVEQARARYQSGTATNLDVLDAQTAVAEAYLAREQALYSQAIANTALQQAIGTRLWESP